jgi:hypothetical protein
MVQSHQKKGFVLGIPVGGGMGLMCATIPPHIEGMCYRCRSIPRQAVAVVMAAAAEKAVCLRQKHPAGAAVVAVQVAAPAALKLPGARTRAGGSREAKLTALRQLRLVPNPLSMPALTAAARETLAVKPYCTSRARMMP